MKRTKIVATIGPASDKKEVLEEMMKAGMNVARLNFSHGDYKSHTKLIKNIRATAKKLNVPIAILQDLQGPRIRIGDLKKPIELVKGEEVIITTGKATTKKIPVTYKKLHNDLKKGDRILIADGVYELVVQNKKEKDIICKVMSGGTLEYHKGMNFPDSTVSLSSITDKDKSDIDFGVSQHVDYVALSFVTNEKDVKQLKRLIAQAQKKHDTPDQYRDVKVIVKIEKHEAIKNFNAILKETDGVMVARGDLGIEIPAEDVPMMQKAMISKCIEASKPVIVATQMLDSMIRNPRPTRAEVSDVANAVIDHTDAVMLSGESAAGKYPIESVSMMSKIIKRTERSSYDDFPLKEQIKLASIDTAISEVSKLLASSIKAKAILVVSHSGQTARMVSRFRPELPIYVATMSEQVMHQLNLHWGIVPFLLSKCARDQSQAECALEQLEDVKKFRKGDKVVIITGHPSEQGMVNMVKVHEF